MVREEMVVVVPNTVVVELDNTGAGVVAEVKTAVEHDEKVVADFVLLRALQVPTHIVTISRDHWLGHFQPLFPLIGTNKFAVAASSFSPSLSISSGSEVEEALLLALELLCMLVGN